MCPGGRGRCGHELQDIVGNAAASVESGSRAGGCRLRGVVRRGYCWVSRAFVAGDGGVLGPEGGFTESEIATLLMELPNAHMVGLGPDILRCEVALLNLIGQVNMLLDTPPPFRTSIARRDQDFTLDAIPVRLPIPGRKRAKPDGEAVRDSSRNADDG